VLGPRPPGRSIVAKILQPTLLAPETRTPTCPPDKQRESALVIRLGADGRKQMFFPGMPLIHSWVQICSQSLPGGVVRYLGSPGPPEQGDHRTLPELPPAGPRSWGEYAPIAGPWDRLMARPAPAARRRSAHRERPRGAGYALAGPHTSDPPTRRQNPNHQVSAVGFAVIGPLPLWARPSVSETGEHPWKTASCAPLHPPRHPPPWA